MREQIIEIMKRVRNDIDYDNDTAMIDDGILDSFDVVGIVSELMAEFNVEIDVDEITPDNFNSVDGVVALIERL